MTVLAKRGFTSSKPVIVRLSCLPPCGPFSIQENAVGGLSYKAKKAAYPAFEPDIPLFFITLYHVSGNVKF